MKYIQLSQGKKAIVDNNIYEELRKHRWYTFNGLKTDYAASKIGLRGKTVFMHRMILPPPKGMFVDHINHNGLDNQRNNLRICDASQNQQNRGKNKSNLTGYKGVSWDKTRNKWKAQIMINRKQLCIGRYKTAEEAAHAYDKAAKELHGEFAETNFH